MQFEKFKKSTGSALILAGSLVSLFGQQSANADRLDSILKFFFKNHKQENEEELSLKERKEKYIQEISGVPANPGGLCLLIFGMGFFFSCVSGLIAGANVSGPEAARDAACGKAFNWGVSITALTVVGLGVYYYIKLKNANKDFEELKSFIREGMLEKQWNLKDFQEMVNNENDCKEFLNQLLVLGPSLVEDKETSSISRNNDDKLDKKVKALQALFNKKPEDLKKLKDSSEREIYKEISTSLYDWCIGRMERFFYGNKEFGNSIECRYGEERYFGAQVDIELMSKIILLHEIVSGEKANYPECLSFLTSEDLYKKLTDNNKPNFRKLLLYDIRKYVTDVSEEDANDDYIINILTELTKSTNNVGTIKTMRDHIVRRDREVLVFSANNKNKGRNNQYFKDSLQTFSEERKKENKLDTYKKQLRILKGFEKFSDEKHRFKERFDEKEYNFNDDRWTYVGIVDNLSFRAQSAYDGIFEEYNKIVQV